MIMTSKTKNPYPGLPPPVTKLTVEQDFQLRRIYDQLIKPETKKEDIITVFMALQEQAYVLGNSLTNLVHQWPKTQSDHPITSEELSMFGILLETKD